MLSALASLWTWTAILVLILVWLPLLGLIRLFDRDPAHYRTGRWFRRLGALITKVNPAWKITEDTYELPDPRRPYVVVCNHQSMADIPIISRLPWEMKWVAKAELFRIPVVGWMMRLAGDIAVERGDKRSGVQVLMTARQYLQKNCSVMFFPEGTRTRDGRLLRFTDGAFRMAIKEQVPILPLVLDGTQNTLPKHSWKFGRAEAIRLKMLPIVETTGLKSADTAALREQVRGQIAAQLMEWRGQPLALVDASVKADDALEAGEVKDSVKTP